MGINISNSLLREGVQQDTVPIYATIANRPSASSFGIGMCTVASENKSYFSDGVNWRLDGGTNAGIYNFIPANYTNAINAFKDTKAGLRNSSVYFLGDSILAGTNSLAGVNRLQSPPSQASRLLNNIGFPSGYQTWIGGDEQNNPQAIAVSRDVRLASVAAAVTFTGSITGSVLTVTGTPTGTLAVNQPLKGNGIIPGTIITSFGTGVGGAGTYNLNYTYTVPINAETMTGYAPGIAAGFTLFAQNDFFANGLTINNTTTNSFVFEPDQPTDTIEIVYFDNSGYNAFDVSSNGSSIGTATITGTSNWKREIFKATSLAYNRYTLTRTVTGSSLLIGYIRCYNSKQPEITIFNCSSPGASGDTWFAKTPTQTWSTLNSIANANYKPDLVFIQFGVNDENSGVLTIPTFEAYMNLAINTLKAAGINMILVTNLPWVNTGVATKARQDLFYNSMVGLAQSQGLAYIDVYSLWGRDIATSVANGLTSSLSDGHPTPLGQRTLGKYYADFINYLATY